MSRWRSEPRPDIWVARRGGSRIRLQLGEFLGEGNSAEVFGFADDRWNDLTVAKLYFPGKVPRNIGAVVRKAAYRRIGTLKGRGAEGDGDWYSPLATPKSLAFESDEAQAPCGVVMSRVDPVRFASWDIFLQQPKVRDDLEIGCLAAECLAEIVAWLHKHHYIIGDFSGTNVRLDRRGFVALLDVDSFGIVGNRTVKPSGDLSRNFIAPEAIWGGATQESDRFVLAMMAVQLLLQGRSPFAGVRPENIELSVQDNITDRHSWLISPELLTLPPRIQGHPGLAVLPATTQRLFRRIIEKPYAYPTADEWFAEMRSIRSTIVQCGCGGKRFSGAICQSCRTGFVLPEARSILPPWQAEEARRARSDAEQPRLPEIEKPSESTEEIDTDRPVASVRTATASLILIVVIILIIVYGHFL